MEAQGPRAGNVPATELVRCDNPADVVDRLIGLYDEAIAQIEKNFEAFARTGKRPEKHPVYPYLGVEVEEVPNTTTLAYGKVSRPGFYGTTITAPRLFRDYLIEQLSLLSRNCHAELYVGKSRTAIPLTFAVERAASAMSAEQRLELARHFPLPRLDAADDTVVDGGRWTGRESGPLALFTAERTDFSLHRLRHYTGTDAPHFQSFVLFTNYQRYIDEFSAYALGEIDAGRALRFVEPGNRITAKGKEPSAPPLLKLPQMPAYHLVQASGEGITLINIGVGPSNAKTVTDHLAVLRPHVWLMGRPLRRLARQPAAGRLRAGERLSARRPCAGRGAAAGHPGADHREVQLALGAGGDGG
ncbi:MAG: AMP nucleosidase [Rhizomicrobium sp.]